MSEISVALLPLIRIPPVQHPLGWRKKLKVVSAVSSEATLFLAPFLFLLVL
jgi:hypothetical protein